MTADGTSLRERKKSKTRTLLAETAQALFETHGFDEVTVDQIAEAAEVSPRTFFRYFGSKEAVLFADQDELIDSFRRSFAARSADEPPLVSLHAALRALSDDYVAHRPYHLRRQHLVERGATLGTYRDAVLRPRWEEAIATALAERSGLDVAVDLTPRLFAGLTVSVLSAASASWVAEDGATDISELIDEAFAALAGAVHELGMRP